MTESVGNNKRVETVHEKRPWDTEQIDVIGWRALHVMVLCRRHVITTSKFSCFVSHLLLLHQNNNAKTNVPAKAFLRGRFLSDP